MSTRKVIAPRGQQAAEAQKNASGKIRVDKAFLDKFESCMLDEQVSTILSKAEGNLNFSITPTGQVGFSVVDKTGKMIADKADILKAQGAGAFINSERKQALKGEKTAKLEASLAAVVAVARDDGFSVTAFPAGFAEVYRGCEATMKILAHNIGAIEAREADGLENTVRNMFLEFGLRIRSATGRFLKKRTETSEGDPPKLNEELFTSHVPMWVFHRLTSAKIMVNEREFSFINLLFPKDPTKGLALSFKEIRNLSFTNDMLGLFAVMQGPLHIIRNDVILRMLLNVPDTVNLDDPVDAVAKTLQNVPILVVPPPGYYKTEHLFTLLAKNGSKGFTWPVGGAVTPQDNLKFVGTLFKRAWLGVVPRPSLHTDLLSRMFEGFQFDESSAERDPYVQLRAKSKEPGSNVSDYFEAYAEQNVSAAVRRTLCLVMLENLQVSKESVLAGLISIAVGCTLSGDLRLVVPYLDVPHGEVNTFSDNWAAIMLRRETFERGSDPKAVLRGILQDKLFKQRKEPKSNIGRVRSILTPEAARVVATAKSRGYRYLALKLGDWFRSFYSETFQIATADVIAAKLDWFLEQPVVFDHEDRNAFMDPDEGIFAEDKPQIVEEKSPDENDEHEPVENPDE